MTVLTNRLFGRRKGRPLRVRKTLLMDTLLPQLEIKLPLNMPQLFDFAPKQLWLEIGFGGGEHLAQQALRHPEAGFIGCEPFRNGIASLLDHLDNGQQKNVRIFPDDARLLIDALPAAVLDRCYVLFADPWPKSRHADRRFIGRDNIARLARVMKPGATLWLATDHAVLAPWMDEAMAGTQGFVKMHDAATPPDSWIQTRYEEKGLKAGRACRYFCYRRV